MANDEASILRKLMPTAHRRLLDSKLSTELRKASGDVLVLGVGHDPYGHLLTGASTICNTDVDAYPKVDKIADAHDLPFAANTFHSAVAVEVFEHLSRPSVAAHELHRVLVPGGKAFISIPFMFHIHGDPMDFHRFTIQGIRQLFHEFSSVEVSGFGGRIHVLSDLVTTAYRWLIPLRLFNHLTTIGPLSHAKSRDCPTGYWVELTK